MTESLKRIELGLQEDPSHKLDESGIISSIQRFSVHDGPGIRTTIFFKGCPLGCYWCHNPEAIHSGREIRYFAAKCIGCGTCLEICEHGGHVFEADGHIYLRDQCIACGECVEGCYAGALELAGERMTVQQVMGEILLDAPFYQKNNGGITLSGGEPLGQRKFAAAILHYCKSLDIHTAVETSGAFPWSCFQDLLPLTDYWIMDIKHVNDKAHKAATGCSNRLILENAHRLALTDKPLLIHIPVIPTFNDTEGTVKAIGEFVRGLVEQRCECLGGNVESPGISVELLRFHRMAIDKYESLDIEYKAGSLEPPTRSEMRRFEEIIRSCGLMSSGKWLD
jgi:pyruvate formate lyase activating enzyme